MSLDDPVILTCSISGAVANREQCPAIPYTPEEYAAEARRIVDEGGSMIHIHARTPDGTPSYEVEDFRAITEAILAEVGDVVINYSTGAVGVPLEKRIAYLRELRPDVGALNMGSMNYAKYSRRRKEFVFSLVFENSFDTIRALLDCMNECGIRPEHECFDSGHLANLDPLLDMGALQPPLQVSCVMGVMGGIRPTARNLAHMAEQVPDVPHEWGVIGVSRDQWTLVAAALSLGGNVRVGPGGQLLPARRRDGPLQRRPDRAGAADGRGQRPARGDRRRDAAAARAARAGGAGVSGALEGLKVLDLSRLLPGGFCSLMLADFGADVIKVEDTGMGDYVRWAPPFYEGADKTRGLGAVPLAQPRQALDPVDLKSERRARGAAAPRARRRRAAGVLPPRRARPARRRLRGAARGQPGARLLRDHRLRAGRPAARPRRARHELPRPDRPARAQRRRGRAARAGGGPDRRPRRRRADGGVRDPRRAARARPHRRGPVRRRLDGRRRALVAGDGRRALLRRGPHAAARRRRAGGLAALLPARTAAATAG